MATVVSITNPITGAVEQVDKLDHTAQQIDDAVALAPQLSNPNLLDNWYFGNPVNQRGQTSYTGSGYMIDRWHADEVVLAISSGAIRVSRSSVGQWYARIMQNLETELSKEIVGKTCTLSALVKSVSGIGQAQLSLFNISDNANDANIYVDLTGGIDLITVTFVVPESYSGKSLGVFFYPDVNDSHRSNGCDVYAIKLELGSQQTLAHQDADGNWVLNEIPDYGEQLRRCQRYFQIYSAADKRPAKAVDCRPTMRTDPSQGTIAIGGTTYYYNTADL